MRPQLKVLVVEDEVTVALLLEDMLMDLGHEVVGLATRLQQAVQMAERTEIDLAILDINLDGQSSFAVADVLVSRGIPFTFASGYGAAGLEPGYRRHNVIKKPFLLADLQGAIATLVGH